MTTKLSGLLTFHNIKVIWPYGDIHLQYVEMTHEFGEHAKLLIACYIREEYEEKIVSNSHSGDSIELWHIQDNGQESPVVPLFG
ncbi:hypothetical protein D3C77_433460 [compost metagenome]